MVGDHMGILGVVVFFSFFFEEFRVGQVDLIQKSLRGGLVQRSSELKHRKEFRAGQFENNIEFLSFIISDLNL
jgi:hypothetical protein